MQRRTIGGILSLTLMLGSFALPLPAQQPGPDRQIAITIDDLPFDWKQETEPPELIQKLYDQLTRPAGG
jgi:hypothetical protein